MAASAEGTHVVFVLPAITEHAARILDRLTATSKLAAMKTEGSVQ
jgi:hypothetical protein